MPLAPHLTWLPPGRRPDRPLTDGSVCRWSRSNRTDVPSTHRGPGSGRLADGLAGQDAADLHGLPVVVPVEDRVQVVQVGRAAVAGTFALQRGPRGVCVAALTDPASDRSNGAHCSSPSFVISEPDQQLMRPMTY